MSIQKVFKVRIQSKQDKVCGSKGSVRSIIASSASDVVEQVFAAFSGQVASQQIESVKVISESPFWGDKKFSDWVAS